MTQCVFYLNPGATADVLAIIREELPLGWTLLSPDGTSGEAHLAACDFILIPDQPLCDEQLAAAPRLKLIQHQGVGYERIDVAACRARTIPVCLTPEGTTIGVAEHTILLILAAYKQLAKAVSGVKRGQWMQWELRGGSFELASKTLGLIGFGRIGREVAKRALAFDARVMFYDPLVTSADDPRVIGCESLPALVRVADIISLHVPLTEANRRLVNHEFLSWVKPNALLVNTARGGLVDEGALFEALTSGRLSGAALDVLEKEPPDPANPLLGLDNVLITPHISAGTGDALKTKMRAAFANMQRCVRGESLSHVVPELADLFVKS